jgi:hypothetical protein
MKELFKGAERKLTQSEEKQVYIQVLTTFGSREAETRVALGYHRFECTPRPMSRFFVHKYY